MKPRKNSSRPSGHFFTASLATFVATAGIHAGTLTWDADGLFNNGTLGGTGTWDTTSARWDNGASDVVWTNNAGTPNSAVFSGTAGTVTTGAAINVDTVTFSTSGYTLERSTNTTHVLTFGGIKVVNTGVLGTSSTINAKLTGASVNISNAGTVTFGGVDDNNGFSMIVNSGATAILAKASTETVHVVGTTGVTVNAGGVAKLGGTGGDQIFNNGTVTLAGGTFDLSGLSETINNLAGATGTVDNSAAGPAILTLGSNNGTATFSGTIQNTGGALGLTKIGSGTATLSGVSTYTGPTTVNGGVLLLSGAPSSLSASATPITLGGGEFRLNNTTAAGGNNNNRIADTQGFLLNGGGFFNYIGSDAGASTETIGPVTLGAGGQARIGMAGTPTNIATLTLASLTRNAGGVVALVNGTDLGFDSTSDLQRIIVTTPPTLVGTTAALSTGINSAATNTHIVPFLVGETTSATGGAGTVTGLANTFVTYNATTGLRPLNLEDEFTFNGTTAGENILITEGTSGTNDTINSLVLEGGVTAPVLDIPLETTLTNTSGAVLFSGATGANKGVISGAGKLGFGSNEAVLTVNPTSGTGISSPVISAVLSGMGGLTKSGSGQLTLSAFNEMTGALNANQGTTILQNTTAFSTFNVAPGATLALNPAAGATSFDAVPAGATVNVNSGTFRLTTSSGDAQTQALLLPEFALNLTSATLNMNGANLNRATFPGSVNLTGTNTFSFSPIRDRLTLSGVVSGTGNLVATGGGAQQSHFLVLSNANTYTGSTTITSGGGGMSIQLSDGVDRLPMTTTLTLNGGTTNAQLDLNGQNQGLSGLLATGTVANTAVVNSNATGATLTLDIAAGTTNTYTGRIGADARLITNGTAPGVNIALTKAGAGTLVLSGNNGYTGPTQVNSGILRAGSSSAFGTGATVTLANVASATLDLNNTSTTVSSLAGGGTIGGNVTLGSGTLTVGGAANTIYSGAISGTGGVTKVGSGTQTFSGANTYSGITSVTEGTLSLTSPSLNDASSVSLLIGGQLDLNFSGTDVVGALFIGGLPQDDGIYGSGNSGGLITGTGTIQVGVVVPAGYAAWATSKGLTGANNGATQDPNFNGIANLLEYVLNGEPLLAESPAAILPTLNASGSNFVFTFTRLVDSTADTTQTFEYGTTLTGWTTLNISPGTPGAGVVIGTPTGGSPNTQTVTVTVPKGASTKLFGRLRAVN
ncbi:autotransporter-associated beta strand repeat-containing protein [Luteolibacter arcticus]|uniref:Autotransporter-associated beta strand repeat-containing protein n=1 Tax=Luteolibacter arcticus TaxID=1581411 RepID=A0ABT3GQG5_9BACT|nr:autotransporter-associated beta strand repeat-containing protein [Luteolibacter arcticus]MCW1925721.1 autotransporter-associated beta strand repeat-containing protein [Luteolibacter arcticus]